MTARCVLVIDDDAQVRQAIQWALEDEGLTVVTAADGREALERDAECNPDLVVLDLTLNGADAHQLAAMLRAGHARVLPILVITADGRAALKAEEAGAYAFVRKPFEIDDFLVAVRKGLGTTP